MKILITGINGFIGRHLAKELIRRGDIVIGIGRNKKCSVDGINKYYSGSILDPQIINKAIKNTDAVIHLAALTSHKDIIDNKFTALETNFHGTKNVLDAFIPSAAKKFFYASTGKVYGKIINLPITETHQTNPLNILGKSKLITEKLIDFYASATLNTNKKEFVIFRIFNIYGSKQSNNFLMPTILKQVKKEKKEIVLGDIHAKRDYIFIDDVINAFVLALKRKNLPGIHIFNICTCIGTSAEKIVKMISKIKSVKIRIKSDASLLRKDEMNIEYGSYALAKKELDWTPKIALAEGLKKLLE